MFDKAFNLLDEPWIRVVQPDAAEVEVSLTDALLGAHAYADLAGELPTQDVAVLRLLLAVLHTVFSRVDCRGQEAPLTSTPGALKRWGELWQLGHFPEEPLRAYLAAWHERFWLFHPERPFYQVNEAAIGTQSGACKLNGEISQSANKERLFSVRSGAQKERLSYAEAARWLLYLNGFDDTSAKPKGKDLPTPGIGWLGKLGLITAVGRNLFETLMLNLVLLPDKKPWPEPEQPCWELERPRIGERVQIAMPRNAAGLLTLQSRRILLQREGDAVTGYTLLGGDFFPREDALLEQMTVWTEVKDKKGNHQVDQPRRHDATRQMWRDFSAIAAEADGRIRPGVVSWVSYLQRAGMLPGVKRVCLRIASVQYGDKDFFISHVFDDRLTFHAELLTEAGAVGYQKVAEEIARVETAAKYAGWLASDLDRAAGGRGTAWEDRAQERLFDWVDAPFRLWLASLDPDAGAEALLEQQISWREQARSLARQLGEEMVAQAGQKAFVGRTVKLKRNGKEEERHYSAPEAINLYMRRLNKLYPANQETGE